MNIRPRLFIGSSSEALNIAKTLKDLLEPYAEVRIWTDVFHLGKMTIETLIREVNLCDYAVLVATPDDLTNVHGNKKKKPRDNVIFESGLFMGRIGSGRTFVLCDFNSKVVMPTDLAGVTFATFNSKISKLDESLKPAVDKITDAIKKRGVATEIDFLSSYLTFILPGTLITESYADIISKCLHKIRVEVRNLEKNQVWSRLLEIKIRLREYFEFSGKFEEGLEFGRTYVRALKELRQNYEAYWSSIKDIGYMYILLSEHELGRKEINQTVSDIETSNELNRQEKAYLLFYCYRYLAISYLRDRFTKIKKSSEYLDKAEKQVSAFEHGSNRHKELQARLLRNRGNICLADGKYEESLKYFHQSLDLFEELEDKEHIGFSHLAIVKALTTKGKWKKGEVEYHLQRAESIFTFLGIIEAHGRVLEQYARYYFVKAKKSKSISNIKKYCEDALKSAENSKNIFFRMKSKRLQGRLEELERQITEFKGEKRNAR